MIKFVFEWLFLWFVLFFSDLLFICMGIVLLFILFNIKKRIKVRGEFLER